MQTRERCALEIAAYVFKSWKLNCDEQKRESSVSYCISANNTGSDNPEHPCSLRVYAECCNSYAYQMKTTETTNGFHQLRPFFNIGTSLSIVVSCGVINP